MNHRTIRDVMSMYKERRIITAQGEELLQGWTLSATGGESGVVEGGGDERAAGTVALDGEWVALLTENAPLAFRVARGVLRNDADAEDVAQETLLRAYRRFSRLRERAKFRSWLVRISFRISLDRLRSAKRRQQREAQWVFENSRRSTGENSEFHEQLQRALDELPEQQRLVLLLAAMEGHTLDEVARLIGIPLGTVKSRLFKAKKTLAESLRCFANLTGRT